MKLQTLAQRRHTLAWLARTRHIGHMMNAWYVSDISWKINSPDETGMTFHCGGKKMKVYMVCGCFSVRWALCILKWWKWAASHSFAMFFSWPLFLLHPTLNQQYNALPPPIPPLLHRASLWTTLIKQAFNDAARNATLGSEQWCD